MKITSDVRDGAALPVRSGNANRNAVSPGSPAVKPVSNRLTDQQLQQSILSRLAAERSMGDALSIAQVSQSLIQKAIIVSTQLRNIASQAMLTGRIDQAALSQAVADIPGDVQNQEPAVTVQLQRVAGTADMGHINPAAEIAEMRKMSEAMTAGAVPARTDFDVLQMRLGEKSGLVMETLSRLQKMLGGTPAEYRAENEGAMEQLSAETVRSIAEYPKTALIAQGNLNREAAGLFLG